MKLLRAPRSAVRRPLLPILLAVGATVGATVGCGQAPPPEPAPEPAPVTIAVEPAAVATVQQLMDALVIPASAVVWDAGREPPTDDEAWQRQVNAAVQLAEAANLLLIGDRRRDDETWLSTAASMRDAGSRALAAAQARDVDALLDAGNVLIESCELCHERHLVAPEPADPPAP